MTTFTKSINEQIQPREHTQFKAHSDAAHSDVAHGDTAHADGTDGKGGHSDVAHTDAAHSDDAHADTVKWGVINSEFGAPVAALGRTQDSDKVAVGKMIAELLQMASATQTLTTWFRIFGDAFLPATSLVVAQGSSFNLSLSEIMMLSKARKIEVGKVLAELKILPGAAPFDSMIRATGKFMAETLMLAEATILKSFQKIMLEWPGPFNPFFVESPDNTPGIPGVGPKNDYHYVSINKVLQPEQLRLLDTFSRQTPFNLLLTESWTGAAAVSRMLAFHKVLAEALTCSSAASKGVNKSLKELLAVSERTVVKSVQKLLSDTQLMTCGRAVNINKQVRDVWTPVLADRVAASGVHMIVMSEILTTLDQARKGVGLNKRETLFLIEAATRAIGRRVSEGLSILDPTPIRRTIGKVAGENLNLRANDPIKQIGHQVRESTSFSSQVLQKVDWKRSLAELMALLDKVTKTPGHKAGDVMSVTHTLSIQWNIQRRLGELLTLNHQLLRQVAWNRSLVDTIAPGSNASKALGKQLRELLAMNDAISRRLAWVRSFSDQVFLTNVLTLAPGKRLGEGIALSMATQKGVSKKLVEGLTLSDIPIKKALFKKLAEALTANDQTLKQMGKMLRETATFAEFAAGIKPLLKSLGDQFAPSSVVSAQRIAYAVAFLLVLLADRTRYELLDDEFGPDA